jgi:hypothetical protein
MVESLGLEAEIILEPNLPFERKKLYYGAADIFVSMVDNFQETFGVTILEAMAAGLPVVASDFDGYKELVDHGRTGFLVPTAISSSLDPWESLGGLLPAGRLRFFLAQKVSFDMSELISAIETLAGDPERRKSMGSRARYRALEYQWPLVIRRYEEVWRESAAKASKSETAGGRGQPLLVPPVGKTTAHYPTLRLTPDTRLQLSEYGRLRAEEGFRPVLYLEIEFLLDERIEKHLIQRLGQGDTTVSKLAGETGKRFGTSEDTVLLHIDRLVKHGFVTF